MWHRLTACRPRRPSCHQEDLALASPDGAPVEGQAAPSAEADALQQGRRDLRAYLSLPLEQYALLDPRYISRLPASGSHADAGPAAADGGAVGSADGAEGGGAVSGEDGTQLPPSGAFLLAVPLSDIVGIDLTPQLIINVDVDEARGTVSGKPPAFAGACVRRAPARRTPRVHRPGLKPFCTELLATAFCAQP
jgi:hypothetical protein